MHPALTRTDHRPWPLPTAAWTWRQSWCDLLFAHWPVAVDKLRPLVPEELTIQEVDGTSWIGVVPFRMQGVMRRPLPDLPWISAFPELNVRLYVEYEGKPGVWFLSLDATNPVAVWAARTFFHLPYYRSAMALARDGTTIEYRSARRSGRPTALFQGRYGPTSDTYEARPDSLEHRLTERYCLYARSAAGHLYRTEVHHHPWPLQTAFAEIGENTLLEPFRISLDGAPALLHFARRIDVVIWPPVRIDP